MIVFENSISITSPHAFIQLNDKGQFLLPASISVWLTTFNGPYAAGEQVFTLSWPKRGTCANTCFVPDY